MSDQFDQFWSAYPRHVGKVDAETAFRTRKCADRLDKILAAIERGKRSREWRDKQFIPYPATWLRRGGEDDEFTPLNGAQTYELSAEQTPKATSFT